MKRYIYLMVSVMMCALAVTAAEDNRADLGFRGGYQRFEDGDGSFMGGVFLRLPWRSVIMGEGAVMYHTHDEGSVDLEIIPLQLSVMLFVLRRDLDFSPYLLGGMGAYVARRVEDGGDSETDFDFGWHLGLGVDYKLGDRMFVEGDFRYIWLDMDFEDKTVGDTLSDFNNWMATVGFGFRL
ncbi:MAG: porin family protein [Verrucomicrobia bacterium]|nr:porin family protein [Verrucomicrobiota bacterium]MBT7068164.1 porin family protein [Verrucomicrobiota bacterium]MBT7700420.1 porin family protein [Verrucomicrobiota bacterium]